MINAVKLSITVGERLQTLSETPESLVDSFRSLRKTTPPNLLKKLERDIEDALLVRPALDRHLPQLDFLTVRRVERALGFSEFTLFAFSADGRGLPEFGEEVV